MDLSKIIGRFIRELFCIHRYKIKVDYSKRRKKTVEQCISCGKYFYVSENAKRVKIFSFLSEWYR